MDSGGIRKYHAVHEYLDGLKTKNVTVPHNIFLLTDDQNAIGEAHRKFPKKNWMHLNRPRHRGTEGGWEAHTPSNDAKQEVVVISSTFRMMKKCSVLMHGRSSFSDNLARYMKANSTIVNIDESKQDVYHSNNSKTTNISVRF